MLAASLISGFIAFASAAAQQDSLFAALLKRQKPGTPAYACHEACGNSPGSSFPPHNSHTQEPLSRCRRARIHAQTPSSQRNTIPACSVQAQMMSTSGAITAAHWARRVRYVVWMRSLEQVRSQASRVQRRGKARVIRPQSWW
jgi:hypothetical protein